MSRQTERREIFDFRFDMARMTGTQKHSHRKQLPGENRDIARGPRVVDFEKRSERRMAARALAVGDWKNRKAVA